MDEDDISYELTPKGFLYTELLEFKINFDQVDEIWYKLEAFCYKKLKKSDPTADYAGIIFDGGGGAVCGFQSNPDFPDSEEN